LKAVAIKNGLWNAFANAAGTLTGVVSSILIVRSLSPVAYGTFSYYIWLAGILSILGTLAFPNAITKITSELQGDQRQSEARVLSRWVVLGLLGLNLLLSAGIIIWAFRLPAPGRIYLLIISVVTTPNALMAVLRSTLWGQERYKPVALTMIIGSVLQLGFTVLVYLLNWGVPGFLLALFSTSVVQAIGLVLIVGFPFDRSGTISKVLPTPEHSIFRRYLAFAFPATLVLCYEVIVWQRSEIFFLGWLSNLEQVGFYNLAYTIFSMLLTSGWALLHGFYPAMSRHYGAGEWFHIHEKVRQGVIFAALFAVPLTFGGWAVLNNLTVLMYTPKMLPSVPAAQVLLLGLLPGVITGLFSMLVNAVGGIWLQVKLGLAISAVSIGLDLILIPRFGALGAAIASTTTQLAYAIFLAVIIRRKYQIMLPFRPVVSIVVIGAFTTFLVPTLTQSWFSGIAGLVSAIIVAAALYMTTTFSLGYFRSIQAAEVGA